MLRQTRQQIDEEIVDRAAGLYARHGFQETSVQRIADAVGYSKGGLLRHFPSKETLQAAVISRCLADLRAVAASVADHPPGPERDRAAVTGLAHLALRRPGFFALLLATLARGLFAPENAPLKPMIDVVMDAFSLTPDTDLRRAVRVAGAVGALAVARTGLAEHLTADLVDELIAVGHDALGPYDSRENL